jgi:hypothetical protein
LPGVLQPRIMIATDAFSVAIAAAGAVVGER